jgi:FMN-dependent NADH-azoreductase
MSKTILHIDASARKNGSLSREISKHLVDKLAKQTGQEVVYRDLAESDLPLVTEKHIEAYYTREEDRSDEQKAMLSITDKYIAELKAADTLVIAAPIYNFSVPAALKAWIDLVCRVGETFVYTENGPQGLTGIDKAYIVVASGGVPLGSPVDFNSAYLQQVCNFIGVKESEVIDATGSNKDAQLTIEKAKTSINNMINESVSA